LVYRWRTSVETEKLTEWITFREVCRLLGVPSSTGYKIVESGKVHRRSFPGVAPRYSRADIQSIIDGSIEVGPREKRGRKRKAKAEAVAT
jgi:hypothetical protein